MRKPTQRFCLLAALVLLAIQPYQVTAQQKPPLSRQGKTNTSDFPKLIERWRNTGDQEERIAVLEAILEIWPKLTTWPLKEPRKSLRLALLHSLGDSYLDRKQGLAEDNLREAIRLYQRALTEVGLDDLVNSIKGGKEHSPQWAETQAKLGKAYAAAATSPQANKQERADNLDNAFRAFAASLTVWTHEGYPQQWNQVQKELDLLRKSQPQRR